MTPSILYNGNYGTIVYQGHAGFFVSTVLLGSDDSSSGSEEDNALLPWEEQLRGRRLDWFGVSDFPFHRGRMKVQTWP